MQNTVNDRVRKHRARKKAAENITKKTPMTSAERVRNFRERQKRLRHISAVANVESAACYTPYIQDAENNSSNQQMHAVSRLPYTQFHHNRVAHDEFKRKFYNNSFGHACCVCDRLWFKNDLKNSATEHEEILEQIIDNNIRDNKLICSTCFQSLNNKKIPLMSTYNGFKYQVIPTFLPPLDLVSERLVSPRIPFMQIRRLRHVHGQFGIYGQIINVPISVNNMVRLLPRHIDDDHCINVHIKRKKIHRTSYVMGLVNKRIIRSWLQYLVQTPLYLLYDIKIDESFFNDNNDVRNFQQDEISENISIEESLYAQQQTLLWDDNEYLRIAPGEHNLPQSILFDEHAEELSFPSIYLGHFRTFRDGIHVTPFTIATSELRRSDRRAVTPYHLLYIAIKIMRIRVRDSLTIAFKHIGVNTKITRQQIESDDYINNCIESNLAFLRSIPNSTWYWSERKKDLFAMIRQLGKPTMFLTLSANEIGWNTLLQTLYKLSHNGTDISEEEAEQMNYIQKSTLVNEDAVTCAIYFNKLVNILMNILQSKKNSPFGIYNVTNYFKRIEFQHRGSPHAHILLWLNNAPKDALATGKQDAIKMIDQLISVSAAEASGNIKLQTHKHSFTCFKMNRINQPQKCRFEAPFMPSKYTTILTPMPKDHPGFANYAQRYKMLRINLENNDYPDIESFYDQNNITCEEDYFQILKAGITRPRVFIKRLPSEKWHNPFNPFVFNILKSNTDFQFIIEEYSCATYVVEYVNKTNRGISNLQRQIHEIMNENPEFDIVEITRKMSVNMLNTVELTSQEAAWYLLREPMSKCSTVVVYISTVWPVERHRIKKTLKQLEEIHADENSTNIWKENWFDKYEHRPEDMELITLAQFVANYSQNSQGKYTRRKEQRIIRYRNYDMASDINEYKREMVTLHIPYRNEEIEVLAEMKFIDIYDQNEDLILQRRKQFESDLNIDETIEICRKLCRENGVQDSNDDDEVRDVIGRFPEANPFQALYDNPNADVNNDLRLATLNKLGAIAKKKENLMPNQDFIELMRMSNEKQKDLLMHVISHLQSGRPSPLQMFFTGPAGCGKTFVIRLLMEIYNRYTQNDGYCNAYITCASTGKAAVAINGSTVHTALKISLSRLLPLSIEVAQQYRSLFKYVHVVIIDEISMIGAKLLHQIDARLKQITGNFRDNFGGLDLILIGDLRQLPPVRATPIYKQLQQQLAGPILWQSLQYYELTQVMRQADQMFSTILTKIGDGRLLEEEELYLIESRFFTRDEADRLCPDGIRLFFNNRSVSEYNNRILNCAEVKVNSIATDVYIGCRGAQEEASMHRKLHTMSTIDTGGLPYEVTLVLNKSYILTTNIDVSDGLANGATGKLIYIEYNDAGEIGRLWLEFPLITTGEKIRKKVAALIQRQNLSQLAVPIERRTCSIPLVPNKTLLVKRNHFPIVSACAITIHKSQGGTFNEIVYEYDVTHPQQLVYVALSRVTNVQGLYIVTKNDNKRFNHGRRTVTSLFELQAEFQRLSLNKLETIGGLLTDFITKRSKLSIFSLNCQSLHAHVADISSDRIAMKSNFLILSETWLNNEDHIDIPNFDLIVKFKRNIRAGGVAIYHNSDASTHLITPQIDIMTKQNQSFSVHISDVGEMCACHCTLEDGQMIVIVAIYISPNTSINNIIEFIHENLVKYTPQVSKILRKKYHELPMILSGDFNVNFAELHSKPLVEFLDNTFNLKMSNEINKPTTRSGTTIDAVFQRFMNDIRTETFVTYFSYHKPLVSSLEISENDSNIDV